MSAKTRFKSDISEAIHSSAQALHKAGVVDEAIMHAFDIRHLVDLPADEQPQAKKLQTRNRKTHRAR